MFTPINSSDAVTGSPEGSSVSAQEESGAPSSATTVASAYLGRGDVSKKPITKGRKRKSTADAPSKTKRRQKSDLNDSLKVHKAGIEDELTSINYENLTPANFKASSSKASKKKTTASHSASAATSVSTGVDELASTAAKPIPVYSSKTTMDALDTTSVPTSVECAKASDGQGFTLYQGPSSTASYSSSIAITKPTISKEQQASQISGEAGPSNRRSARLKKAANVQTKHSQLRRSSGSFDNPLAVDEMEEIFSDIEMVDLAESNESEPEMRPNTPPQRGRKLNTRDVDELEDYGGALLSDADKRALDKINTGTDSALKPIVRKPFPPPILDRSPIFGVSSGVVLRTCFRVGEAMVTGCHGVRNGHDIVIELYARVTASWREPAPGRKQHFQFKDIYHDNPPHLEGSFELWQQAQLWDLDSKVFLGASKGKGIMCRAIARMKRDGQKWRLDVLSVWEATWDDVEFAAGICTNAVGK